MVDKYWWIYRVVFSDDVDFGFNPNRDVFDYDVSFIYENVIADVFLIVID